VLASSRWSPEAHQGPEPNPIKTGTKVVAIGCNLIKNSQADLKTPIQQGNTCVVRQAQVAPDDAVMIQLIGVTVVRFGKAWESCWDARGLKPWKRCEGATCSGYEFPLTHIQWMPSSTPAATVSHGQDRK
jgi:hypothetical protein